MKVKALDDIFSRLVAEWSRERSRPHVNGDGTTRSALRGAPAWSSAGITQMVQQCI
jgi:hypothetical protein